MKEVKMPLEQILIRPIITEKSYNLQEKRVYIFEVAWNATKPEIKKAVEKIYEVKVEKVRTLKQYGKRKTVFTKDGHILQGKKPHIKKAYIYLKEGYKIDIYKGV